MSNNEETKPITPSEFENFNFDRPRNANDNAPAMPTIANIGATTSW